MPCIKCILQPYFKFQFLSKFQNLCTIKYFSLLPENYKNKNNIKNNGKKENSKSNQSCNYVISIKQYQPKITNATETNVRKLISSYDRRCTCNKINFFQHSCTLYLIMLFRVG